MTLRSAILALLLCAAHAQARTLYVSLAGSHDTNAPAFSTWATAATNIQAAIDAASDGDTVRVAHGTHVGGIVVSNKTGLTVQGGRGTLFDADKTIVDANFASKAAIVTGSTNTTLSGLTFFRGKADGAGDAGDGGGIYLGKLASPNTLIDSCIVRNCYSTYGAVHTAGYSGAVTVRNSIVVGNYGLGGVQAHTGTILSFIDSICEGNNGCQLWKDAGTLIAQNSIYGNTKGIITSLGGNLTSNTTNSVCRLLDIAPASEGVGTNLVWRGVSAYIPRLDSLARKNGVAYAGIATASDGAGGPALVTSRPFLGRDVSTNRNHGRIIGGVTASTNSPFAGERSAAFDGASGYVDIGADFNQRLNGASAITLEAWVNPARTNRGDIVQGHTQLNGYYGWALVAENGNVDVRGRSTGTETFQGFLNSAAPTGAWTHAAGILDYASGELLLYINGTLATNMSASWSRTNFLGTVPSLGSNIGAGSVFNSQNRTNFFLGSLSDVRIWNVARTPEQIAENYTNRLTGTEEGLVGYWPLTGTTSPIDTGPFNLDNPTIHPTYMEAF